MSSDEISINIKGPSELKLTISISPEKSVRDLKEAIAERSEVEADRQRLIYSGTWPPKHYNVHRSTHILFSM